MQNFDVKSLSLQQPEVMPRVERIPPPTTEERCHQSELAVVSLVPERPQRHLE